MLGYLFTLTLMALAPAQGSEGVRFYAEFSPAKYYVGQQVMCQFIVEGPFDMVEVEVAKFPEFRGFWSENVSLRQGPLPLSESGGPGHFPRALIGSYLMSPMVGRNDVMIAPMRLVVRDLRGGSSTNTLVLESEVPPFRPEPLPPVPHTVSGIFSGVVGQLQSDGFSGETAFQKDEPVVLRWGVQGEANFAELGDLAMTWGDSIELISKRSYDQGSGSFGHKTFEYTMVIHSEEDQKLQPQDLLYFDPHQGKYRTVSFPAQTLKFAGATTPTALQDPITLELKREWSNHEPWHHRVVFWLPLIAGLVLLGFAEGRQILQTYQKHREDRVAREAKVIQWQDVLSSYQSEDLSSFLENADLFATQEITKRLRVAHPTRKVIWEGIQGEFPAPLREDLRYILETYERFAYSPTKTPPDKEEVLNRLKSIKQAVR